MVPILQELLAHHADKYFLENGQPAVVTSEFALNTIQSEYLEAKFVEQVMEKSKQRVQKAFGDPRKAEGGDQNVGINDQERVGDQEGKESDQDEGESDQEEEKSDQMGGASDQQEGGQKGQIYF